MIAMQLLAGHHKILRFTIESDRSANALDGGSSGNGEIPDLVRRHLGFTGFRQRRSRHVSKLFGRFLEIRNRMLRGRLDFGEGVLVLAFDSE
jgi:hypothetical protein